MLSLLQAAVRINLLFDSDFMSFRVFYSNFALTVCLLLFYYLLYSVIFNVVTVHLR
jgi:hypothetical protein